MIKRLNTNWTIALFAVLASSTPFSALAGNPAKPMKASADPRTTMTPEQLAEKNAQDLKKFDAERLEVARQPPPTAYLNATKRPEYHAPQRPKQPVEVRVEKFYDGSVLYSRPL